MVISPHASPPARSRPVPVRLGTEDAGELLTLQRAGYVTEGQKHDTVWLPPLTQTLRELRFELEDPQVVAIGVRERSRLVAAVRLRHRTSATVELARLVVAPDRQGFGLGSYLLAVAEAVVTAQTERLVLFTGARSADNLRLYRRHGYRETHRTAAGGHELVHLAKRLPTDRPASTSSARAVAPESAVMIEPPPPPAAAAGPTRRRVVGPGQVTRAGARR